MFCQIKPVHLNSVNAKKGWFGHLNVGKFVLYVNHKIHKSK